MMPLPPPENATPEEMRRWTFWALLPWYVATVALMAMGVFVAIQSIKLLL